MAALTPLNRMTEAYQSTVQIYIRKLEKAVTVLHGGSKEAKVLNALCTALNIEGGIKDSNLIPFLAWLRALDMVQGPS